MRGRKWLSAALLRMTAPSRFATALRALQVGMACGHGASRIALAYKQLPGIVRRFQQQVPCSIGATRRNVDNSRAFDHIGRFGWTSCPCSLTLEAWAFLIQGSNGDSAVARHGRWPPRRDSCRARRNRDRNICRDGCRNGRVSSSGAATGGFFQTGAVAWRESYRETCRRGRFHHACRRANKPSDGCAP